MTILRIKANQTIVSNKFTKELKTKSQLHTIIVFDNNQSDHLGINLYWDHFRSWYSPKKMILKNSKILHIKSLKTNGIYLNYAKLAKIYNCSQETIRLKIVKLENLGLIQRSFQHKNTASVRSFNQLIVYVLKNTPFFFNPYGIDIKEIKDLTPQTNHEYISKKYNINYGLKAIVNKAFSVEGGIQMYLDTKELIEPFIKIKDRSTQSNFYKNNFNSKESTRNQKENLKQNFKFQENRGLKDFYPLSHKDCIELQKLSNRQFSLNAMNEILLDMSKRLADRLFRSKKAFMSYMTKVFTWEKRDAVRTSNDSFRIRNNLTQSEIDFRKQEEFLRGVEYSLEVSPEAHFRKKLAAVFETAKAYEILRAYRGIKLERTNDGLTFKLVLNKNIKLTKRDKETMFEQVLASHGKVEFDNDNVVTINKLEIMTVRNLPCDKRSYKMGEGQSTKTAAIDLTKIKVNPIWNKVINKLLEIYGEHVYRNWFSKLSPSVNEEQGNIFIQVPSTFIRDWIKSHYFEKIESITKAIGYKAVLLQEVTNPTYSCS